jgi:short chain dehydrogenase
MNQIEKQSYTIEEIDKCIKILTHLLESGDDFANLPKDKQIKLMKAAGQLSRPDQYQLTKRNKAIRKKHRQQVTISERKARSQTGIRMARDTEVFAAPLQLTDHDDCTKNELHLNSPRNCYVCKAEYTRLHFFYDSMCPSCAELNYKKRFQTSNLNGQIAVITGSRLKIGYQATLLMLRAGAIVIATTRFPVDSALRYSRETDFSEWKDRLHIYGLDLRHTPSVEIFCAHVDKEYQGLDILINNAAQTVRRPPGFYAHLMVNETKFIDEIPENAQKLLNNFSNFTRKLNSFADSQSSSDLTLNGDGDIPGIGLRESAQLSQTPYAYDKNLSVNKVFPQGNLM